MSEMVPSNSNDQHYGSCQCTMVPASVLWFLPVYYGSCNKLLAKKQWRPQIFPVQVANRERYRIGMTVRGR